jgi:hypothetical protein
VRVCVDRAALAPTGSTSSPLVRGLCYPRVYQRTCAQAGRTMPCGTWRLTRCWPCASADSDMAFLQRGCITVRARCVHSQAHSPTLQNSGVCLRRYPSLPSPPARRRRLLKQRLQHSTCNVQYTGCSMPPPARQSKTIAPFRRHAPPYTVVQFRGLRLVTHTSLGLCASARQAVVAIGRRA